MLLLTLIGGLRGSEGLCCAPLEETSAVGATGPEAVPQRVAARLATKQSIRLWYFLRPRVDTGTRHSTDYTDMRCRVRRKRAEPGA